jgi:acyl-CoA thioesterase-2
MPTIPPWNGDDMSALLALDAVASMHFRSRLSDVGVHDRIYGGQMLAQALVAAARTVPAGRSVSMQQLLFLQGALGDQPIDFHVTALQDGKRFSARHVRGSQAGGRTVFDAQVTFAASLPAPTHMAPPAVASFATEDPWQMARPAQFPKTWERELERALNGYSFGVKPIIDFRVPEVPEGMRLALPEPRLRFWLRLKQTLPDDDMLHSAAFAYLSDWWLNYAAVGGHVEELAKSGGSIYVASLNHTVWHYRPVRADAWLHFDCSSPSGAAGRGLSIARVHDREGKLVAIASQECLMASA